MRHVSLEALYLEIPQEEFKHSDRNWLPRWPESSSLSDMLVKSSYHEVGTDGMMDGGVALWDTYRRTTVRDLMAMMSQLTTVRSSEST